MLFIRFSTKSSKVSFLSFDSCICYGSHRSSRRPWWNWSRVLLHMSCIVCNVGCLLRNAWFLFTIHGAWNSTDFPMLLVRRHQVNCGPTSMIFVYQHQKSFCFFMILAPVLRFLVSNSCEFCWILQIFDGQSFFSCQFLFFWDATWVLLLLFHLLKTTPLGSVVWKSFFDNITCESLILAASTTGIIFKVQLMKLFLLPEILGCLSYLKQNT